MTSRDRPSREGNEMDLENSGIGPWLTFSVEGGYTEHKIDIYSILGGREEVVVSQVSKPPSLSAKIPERLL